MKNVPLIDVNFSNSNSTRAGATRTLATANASINTIANRLAQEKQFKHSQQVAAQEQQFQREKFEADQAFRLSAPERAVAQQQALLDAERQDRKAQFEGIGSILDNQRSSVGILKENLAHLETIPQYQDLSDVDKVNFQKEFTQHLQKNLSLSADPDAIIKDVRAFSRSQGLSKEQEQGLISTALRDANFNLPSAEQVAQRREQNSKFQEQQAALMKQHFNKTVSGVGSGGAGKKFSSSDSRKNSEFLNDFLERVNASDSAHPLSKIGNFFNPFNDEDVTRENILPYITSMAENGIDVPAALMVLEGKGTLAGGEFNTSFFDGNNTANGVLRDPEKFKELVKSAEAIQGGKNNRSGSGSGRQGVSIADQLGALKASQQDLLNSNAAAGSGPTKATPEQRREAMLTFFAEKHGKPISNLKLPDKSQTKKALIDVRNPSAKPKPKPQAQVEEEIVEEPATVLSGEFKKKETSLTKRLTEIKNKEPSTTRGKRTKKSQVNAIANELKGLKDEQADEIQNLTKTLTRLKNNVHSTKGKSARESRITSISQRLKELKSGQ